ncbi:MAG: hypothetical protein JSU00_17880 [Acidobacteria bacterium]|nr:hypothetical protein [Acidobacteriota bacterium]
MRFQLVAFVLMAGALSAQDTPEMVRTEQEISRLRELVAMGAIAPLRLQEAEQRLGDARDDQILHRTLYGKLSVEELTPEQSREMLEAAQRRFDRQQARLAQTQKLVAAGVIARADADALSEELESRRLTIDLARSRARLLEELAEMARREEQAAEQQAAEAARVMPAMERFDGERMFTASELKAVSVAFEKKFKKPLPISANGETSMHRALGFDHRGRVDVAVSPDQVEGVWLRTYLESNAIPYYAFRSAVPGKATGAHIHIGPGSTKLRAAD